AAVLPPREADSRRREAERRRDTTASARGVLEDPAVVLALASPAVDLEALATGTREATRRREECQVRHRRALDRSRRLAELGEELDRVLEAWEPVRAEHEVVAGLAALVEGKSADNQWRMRLSAYVLGERLRQVVAAANERLVGMTDRRYTLEQEDEKGAGERRGGLSLRVLDEWSGTRRDPATLSGGETFVVSLALALGLADTVSHEAGGTQLDTLFIDEGFGSLDAATLDHVMDTLDTLRDGGRVVGLVSHVTELRTRVTSQLEVRKGRSGSTVHLVLARG
ncbi:MAG: sbcC, partial [Marmoricola sp.]|nr:sbcC [Marmoricola sp.]